MAITAMILLALAIICLFIYAYSKEDSLAEAFSVVVGIISIIMAIFLGIFTIASLGEMEETKTEETKEKKVIIQKEIMTEANCKQNEFCKIKRVTADMMCLREGCTIIKDSINEIDEF